MPILLSSMLLCALVTWLLFGMLTAVGYRLVRPALLHIDARQASHLLLGWLALPPLAAVITTTVMYSPDIAQWLVTGHCHTGTCRQHGPQSALAIWPAALLLMWVCGSLGRCLHRQWLPAHTLRKELVHAGCDAGDYVQLDSAEPAAFTLGLRKPQIFITAGMQAACSPADIDCILAHERAHRQRYDNLRLLAARLFTAPLPLRWKKTALSDLTLCCEKASDLGAAGTRSPEAVASALLRVARLQQFTLPRGSLAFGGTQTEQRIVALLDEAPKPLAGEFVFACAAAALLCMLLLINPLHRAIELIP